MVVSWYAGDSAPDGVQRLLATCQWNADLVRDDLRSYVVEHLGDADGVVVVGETGFIKTSTGSASGTMGDSSLRSSCHL